MNASPVITASTMLERSGLKPCISASPPSSPYTGLGLVQLPPQRSRAKGMKAIRAAVWVSSPHVQHKAFCSGNTQGAKSSPRRTPPAARFGTGLMESDTFPYSQNKPCSYQMKLIVWVEQWQKVSLLLPGRAAAIGTTLGTAQQPCSRTHTEHPMEAAGRQTTATHLCTHTAHNRRAKLSHDDEDERGNHNYLVLLSCVAAVEKSLCTHSGKSTGCFAPSSHLLNAAEQKQGAAQDRAPQSHTQPWLEPGCTELCSSSSPAPPVAAITQRGQS